MDKRIKQFLFVVIGLIGVIVVLSFFMPSKFTSAESVVVKASKQKIFDEVSNLNNWKNWHPAFMQSGVFEIDQNIAIRNGEKAIEIVSTDSNHVMFTVFSKGLRADNTISIFPFSGGDGYTVEWRAVTHLKWYPWQKLGGIVMTKLVSNNFIASLGSLKSYCETSK